MTLRKPGGGLIITPQDAHTPLGRVTEAYVEAVLGKLPNDLGRHGEYVFDLPVYASRSHLGLPWTGDLLKPEKIDFCIKYLRNTGLYEDKELQVIVTQCSPFNQPLIDTYAVVVSKPNQYLYFAPYKDPATQELELFKGTMPITRLSVSFYGYQNQMESDPTDPLTKIGKNLLVSAQINQPMHLPIGNFIKMHPEYEMRGIDVIADLYRACTVVQMQILELVENNPELLHMDPDTQELLEEFTFRGTEFVKTLMEGVLSVTQAAFLLLANADDRLKEFTILGVLRKMEESRLISRMAHGLTLGALARICSSDLSYAIPVANPTIVVKDGKLEISPELRNQIALSHTIAHGKSSLESGMGCPAPTASIELAVKKLIDTYEQIRELRTS